MYKNLYFIVSNLYKLPNIWRIFKSFPIQNTAKNSLVLVRLVHRISSPESPSTRSKKKEKN